MVPSFLHPVFAIAPRNRICRGWRLFLSGKKYKNCLERGQTGQKNEACHQLLSLGVDVYSLKWKPE